MQETLSCAGVPCDVLGGETTAQRHVGTVVLRIGGVNHTRRLVVCQKGCPILAPMGETTFQVIRQKDKRISVEMAKPGGRKRIIPDFRDEAEANAWIIQMQRLIDEAHPHLPGVKKRA